MHLAPAAGRAGGPAAHAGDGMGVGGNAEAVGVRRQVAEDLELFGLKDTRP